MQRSIQCKLYNQQRTLTGHVRNGEITRTPKGIIQEGKSHSSDSLGWNIWSEMSEEQRPIRHGDRASRQLREHLRSKVQETSRRDLRL
jgi:hypothetical protein